MKKMYLIYTEKEGEAYRVQNGWNKQRFKRLLKDGYFEYPSSTEFDVIYRVVPAYAALVEETDNFDWIIGRKRPVYETRSI